MFKPFDIVITPFPFVDVIGKIKYRPALVISSEEYNQKTNSAIFLMITSAKHSSLWNDYVIQNYSNTNLQGGCVIRIKTFTLANEILKNKIGKLNKIDIINVQNILKNVITL